VTPAAVSLLLIYLKKHGMANMKLVGWSRLLVCVMCVFLGKDAFHYLHLATDIIFLWILYMIY
jgi:hypothetical protein